MNPALPQPDVGKWPSLALAALVHVALILFLFFGVRWQNPPPEAVEISVVDGVPPPPRASAPEPAPRPEPKPEPPKPEPKPEPKPTPKAEPKPPPPPPVKPEIVTKPEPKKPEKPEKKVEPPKPVEKPEKPEKKVEPPKPETKQPKPEAKPVPEKQPDLQADRMKDLLASETQRMRNEDAKRQAAENQRQLSDKVAEESQRLAAAKAGAASKSALNDYINKIKVKVRGNIILPPAVSGNPEAVFLVDQAIDGTVLEVTLKKTSGNSALDAAIEKAIRKSSPLPKPDDPSVFNRNLELKFRPLED
jgi:colicin import membrane protein